MKLLVERHKLRGISVSTGEWVYGTGLTDFLNVYPKGQFPEKQGCVWIWSEYGWHEVIPSTVGMFTGFQDQNGVDLDWWEGDLFKVDNLCSAGGLWFIEFHDGSFVFKSTISDIRCLCSCGVKDGPLKKLGNIHDNEDLIK